MRRKSQDRLDVSCDCRLAGRYADRQEKFVAQGRCGASRIAEFWCQIGNVGRIHPPRCITSTREEPTMRTSFVVAVIVFGTLCAVGCGETHSPTLPTAAPFVTSSPATAGLVGAATSEHAASHQTAPVLFLPSHAVVPGSSSELVRNDNGVTVTLHTTGLTAGNVYTIAFVIFNNPGACATSPCSASDLTKAAVQTSIVFASGHVVGGEGENFAAHLNVGDVSQAISGPGLLNSRKAEIHVQVRSHGPAIPGAIDDQIHQFNGGCPPNACVNVQGAQHLAL
jgi:hypothetical protein